MSGKGGRHVEIVGDDGHKGLPTELAQKIDDPVEMTVIEHGQPLVDEQNLLESHFSGEATKHEKGHEGPLSAGKARSGADTAGLDDLNGSSLGPKAPAFIVEGAVDGLEKSAREVVTDKTGKAPALGEAKKPTGPVHSGQEGLASRLHGVTALPELLPGGEGLFEPRLEAPPFPQLLFGLGEVGFQVGP